MLLHKPVEKGRPKMAAAVKSVATTGVAKSEDLYGEKWDRCLTDSIIKMGSGLGVGLLFSMTLLRRRRWPMIYGFGVGSGMGLANCRFSFNEPFMVPAEKVKVKKPSET